ncbi:hypothetical protein [Clostridium sp. Marseille-P2415]|uniref:hypothetical protein n=1 Tax=Clostridium sp. Marseille-P2415 TaxID=1805471 RepID=UPI00098893F5|nr:hypothetical protein [Clostridium sp. Marseille-P2415]
MRFFTMEQDKSLQDQIRFRDFDICGPRHIFYKEDAEKLAESNMMYLTEDSGETAPDFIQSPVYLVSDKVKKVLDMYEDDMIFKTVTVASKEQETIMVYHHLLLERLDMFSGQTEFYSNGSVKRLVLDPKKVGEHKVFLLNDKRFPNPLVSLEVVESLLRRNVIGVIWKEVEVEAWQN